LLHVRGLAIISDDTDNGVDLNGRAGLDFNFLQYTFGGRRNFSIDLVGGNFEQGFVALYFLAWLLEPFGDSAFKDGLAHLRHDYVSWHEVPLDAV
jgi:hypothetical protein